MTDLLKLARALVPVARAAGEIELKYYKPGVAMEAVMDKNDGSPVTLADQEAEKLITAELTRLAPGIPIVGEEAVAAGHIPDISSGAFFLVDPLDGTREFITGGGGFTVNIGLMENFKPAMGIIYVPVSGALYFGAKGQAFMERRGEAERKISVRKEPAEGVTVVASKHHSDPQRIDDFLRGRKVKELIRRSSAEKFCAVAAGEADIYPRLGPTSEWDTAAGEAILIAAGGRVTTLDGKPLPYGKKDKKFLNPEFVAFAA